MEDFQNLEQNQKIPFLESDEEQPEEQIIEKNQNSCDKIINRQRVKYSAARIKYSPTRIKSRNFLSNISYTGINKNDFYSESFKLDVYVFLVKNLNPFSLQRKLSDKLKQEMVYMLWTECIPIEFYRHICEEKKFVYLNGRDVGQPGALEIVGDFIDQGKKNLRLLQEHLAQFKDIYQYVYLHVFHEVYTTSEKREFDLKSNFHIIFKSYCDKISLKQTAKQESNYQNNIERFEYEQKPIKNFNTITDEEEEIKKKKMKFRMKLNKNKLKKKNELKKER